MDDIHVPLSVSVFPIMFFGCCDLYSSPFKALELTTWTITFPITLSFHSIPQSSKQLLILFIWIMNIVI